MTTDRSTRHLLLPVLGTGVLMAAYLLLRPYGDAAGGDTPAAAAAFASARWIAAHVAGALGLASFALSALRLADITDGRLPRIARSAGLLGAALVLPYYGAETFALHVLGRRAGAGDTASLALVAEVREQPVAVAMFAVGLLALAVSGLTFALAWSRSRRAPRWAAWPLGLAVALVLPQFYLPPTGRMAFGVAYLVAALVLAAAAARSAIRSGAAPETLSSRV
jgi:hypothetical protein